MYVYLLYITFCPFQFISSRLNVIHNHNSAIVVLIGQLLHTSFTIGVGPRCEHPQRMSPSVSSCTARFSLLDVAVQVLRSRFSSNGIDRTLLREKIYNATLDYFWYKPAIRNCYSKCTCASLLFYAADDLKHRYMYCTCTMYYTIGVIIV